MAVGIICEYNPFHLGHEKQLRMIRRMLGEETAVVCLMSGNFVQRGEPAIFDAALRARAAVECGANLVLELPATYSLRSAEGFARGGVSILSRLGVVERLCFGCESGDGAAILRAAQTMCGAEYDAALRAQLESGLSYPAARQRALAALSGEEALLRAPNDILAVEYCKAIIESGSRLAPMAVLREGGYHDTAPSAENPSATAVRAAFPNGNWRVCVPDVAAEIYRDAAVHTLAAGERAMLARLRGMDAEAWQRIPFGSEGLWSKVHKAVLTQPTVEAVIDASVSRRYPRTRLKRMLMCAYLGITETHLQSEARYVRVLGFDAAGQRLLRQIHENAPELLLNAGARAPTREDAAFEARCDGLYALFSENDTAQNEKSCVFRKKT